jgi:hypothetical protein
MHYLLLWSILGWSEQDCSSCLLLMLLESSQLLVEEHGFLLLSKLSLLSSFLLSSHFCSQESSLLSSVLCGSSLLGSLSISLGLSGSFLLPHQHIVVN